MVSVMVLCREGHGRLRVMSIKTSLSMLSAGKFVDKLKCMSVVLLGRSLSHILVISGESAYDL